PGDEAVAHRWIARGLDVAGAGNDPQLLRLPRGVVETLPVVHRDSPVLVSVEYEEGYRADAGHRGERAETVVDGKERNPLERPRDPVIGELLLRDVDVVRDRALEDQRANPVAALRVGDVVRGERPAEALPVYHDARRVDVLAREQRFERGVDIQL